MSEVSERIMKSKTTKVFACQHCGQCCREPGYVYLTPDDIDRIATFLGMDVETFTTRYTKLAPQRRGLSLIDDASGACIFLNEQNECAIQAVKPAQCEAFPGTWRYLTMETICKGWNQ